jgi:outer membrane lipoprotein-sorting protein
MRVVSFFVSTLLFLSQSLAQNSTPVQRDAQALSALAQMLSATGWSSTAQLQDVKATGMVNRYHGDSQDSVGLVLESRGSRLYRTDVQDPAGTVTTVVNGDNAIVITPVSTIFLPFYAAIALRPITFPFFAGTLVYANDNFLVQYEGTDTVSGQQAYKIEMSLQPAAPDPASTLRAQASHTILWVSVSSALPMQIQYSRPSNNDPRTFRQITQTFSDYRTVAGLAIPFHQEEFAGGQLLLSLQLSSVNLNTGVPTSDFAIPVAQD